VEGRGGDALARVLALHAALAPGFRRELEVRSGAVRLVLEPASSELLDPEHPGWLGLLARGSARGLEAMAQAVEPRARVAGLGTARGRIEAEIVLDAARPAEAPKEAAFMPMSTATSWVFDTSEAARS
jgi:hypothetical protein